MAISLTDGNKMRQVLAAVRSTSLPQVGVEVELPHKTVPFITISRQAGVGATSLAEKLAEHLNTLYSDDRPWECFDRQLVEKVAADHNISKRLVESLEDAAHSWIDDIFSGMSFANHSDAATEMKVYRQVAETIRALAQVGRAVLVGRGAAYITQRMPNGAHVRLVAPQDYCVENYAMHTGLSKAEAASRIRQINSNRNAFYKRYWANHGPMEELFSITLNVSTMTEDQCVKCIEPLINFG